MILPDRALVLLLGLRLRGAVRAQLRRMRTPAGALIALVGLGLISMWALGILATALVEHDRLSSEETAAWARATGLVFVSLTVIASLGYRGLAIPKEEIEPLFSAPLARADLVRYRMLVGGLKSLLGWLVFGVAIARRAPNPLAALLGSFLAFQALSVLGQTAALLGGKVERALRGRAAKLALGLVAMALTLLMLLLLFAVPFGGGRGAGPFAFAAELLPAEKLEAWMQSAPARVLTAPLEPWARAVAAEGAGEAALWLALAAGLWLALFELTARAPIDFRELSLATAASVAERIRAARRTGGFGASSSAADKGSHLRRVPWLFGRGPLGAIAWRKSASMARKARGTLAVAFSVLALMALFSIGLFGQLPPERRALAVAVFVGAVGPIYLCGGLRFDFREDLDRMEAIKTWPLHPAIVFAATLLPQVLLVSALVDLALVGVAALHRSADPVVAGIALGVPLLAATWLAIDNLVFLLAPARMVPGQDALLQNAGRALLVFAVRLALLAALALPLVVIATTVFLIARELLDLPIAAARLLALLSGLPLLALAAALLVWLGGRALARFDVSKVRG